MSNKAARSIGAVLAGIMAALMVTGGPFWAAAAASKTRPRALTGNLGCTHVTFIPLEGQAGAEAGSRVRNAKFRVRGTNKTADFASNGVAIALRPTNAVFGKSSSEPWVVQLNFLGAREDVVPEGLDGAAYSRIIYRELWPGIDLVYRGGTDKLDHEFIVRPGADPSRIKLVYQGAETIALTKEGRLAIGTPAGDFEEDVPAGYQEIEGTRKSVSVALSLEDTGSGQNVEAGLASTTTSPSMSGSPVLAMGFDVGPYDRTRTLVLDTAGGYFGRKTGTTSIEVTGGHAGGSLFTLPTGQWIARIGVLGYMKNAPATGMLAIYKNTSTADIKQHVCHTVAGALPVGSANTAWTVLEVAGGPVWLEPGDYWILRNDSGDFANKFVITGEDMGKSSWGWFYTEYPVWPSTTQYLSWVEDFSNVEGCFYAEWDGEPSVPMLTSIAPNTADAGGPGFVLTLTGSGFVEGAVVSWGESDRPTTFVSDAELTAQIDAADVAMGKTVLITVRNPGGEIANAVEFRIDNPRPTLGSLSPANARAGSSGFELVLAGSGFVPGASVLWGGSQKRTVYVGPAELRASILAADVAAGGEVQVTVSNPAPSEGISNTLVFPVSTFGLSPSPLALTITAGQSAEFVITAAPQFGPFDAGVSFACTGLPDQCTASFSPGSVTPGATSAATTLTLTTKAGSSTTGMARIGSPGQGGSGMGLASLIALLLLAGAAGGLRRGRVTVRLMAAGALLGVVLLAWSCGTIGPASGGTPRGTYQVTVEGTSGATKIAAAVTLTVK